MVVEIKGDTASAESVGLVAGRYGEGCGDPVLGDSREELCVKTEDDIAQFTALGDEMISGSWMGGADFGKTIRIDRNGSVGGEGVVEAVAEERSGEGSPARSRIVDCGEGESGVNSSYRFGKAID